MGLCIAVRPIDNYTPRSTPACIIILPIFLSLSICYLWSIAMARPSLWLADFQVNTGSDASSGLQFDPLIIGLATGNFLVAWVDSNGAVSGSFPTDIIGKLYDTEGNVIRDSFQLNTHFFC